MDLMYALSDKDIDQITEYIRIFGPTRTGDCPSMAPLSTILKSWNENKQTLYRLLGNKLIVSRPYSFALPDERLEKEAENQIYDDIAAYNFVKWFRTLNEDYAINDENYCASLRSFCNQLIAPSCLIKNAYPNDTFIMVFADGERFKISKGMRVMKILSKIAQKFNCPPQIFEDFRQWHSLLLNQRYVDGELCLSIHPLDFMTMSDNASGWDSCMRWGGRDGGGDYRCGTVECLNGATVLVAYLKSKNEKMTIDDLITSDEACWLEYDENWSWNSKKWRELFIVDDKVLSEVYPYPFQDEHLTNTVLMWIKELAENNLGWTYDDIEYNNDRGTPNELPHEIRHPGGKYVKYLKLWPEPYSLMYNDFGRMPIHRARVNPQKIIPQLENFLINADKQSGDYFFSYGDRATCMCCGKVLNDDQAASNVFCDICDPIFYCKECGAPIHPDAACYFEDSDDPYCQVCYEEYATTDAITEDVYHRDNMTQLFLLLGKDSNGEEIYAPQSIDVYKPEYASQFCRQVNYDSDNHCWYITLADLVDIDDISLFMTWEDSGKTLRQILAERKLI